MADAADLIVRFLDPGAPPLDAAEHAELNDLLRTDAAARDLLADLSYHARALRESMNPQQNAERSDSLSPSGGWERAGVRAGHPVRPSSAFNLKSAMMNRRFAAAAALLVAVAAAVAIYVVVINLKPETLNPKPAATALIATVSESRDVAWSSEPLNAGDEVAAQSIDTQSGDLELLLRSGATVSVLGASQLSLDGPLHVTMRRGRAAFTCPHDAKGFTVALPAGGRIVDLGTRFEVIVGEDGAGRVAVVEGKVEYHPRGGGGAATALVAGQTATLDASGAIATVVDTSTIDLVRNGGFEVAELHRPGRWPSVWELTVDGAASDISRANTLVGWSIRGSGQWLLETAFWKAAGGKRCLSVNNFPGATMVAEQTVEVTPGQRYELRFDLAGRFDAPRPASVHAIRVRVSNKDGVLAEQTIVAERPAEFDRLVRPGWTTQVVPFVAESGRVVLSFTPAEGTDPFGVAIDDVRLFAASEAGDEPAAPSINNPATLPTPDSGESK